MSAVTRPRGPLPPRVYWTRRLVLLAAALVLVFGVARLLGGGSGGGTSPTAQPVGAEESTPSSPTTSAASSPTAIATAPTVVSSPTGSPPSTPSVKTSKAGSSTTPTALPESTGPCSPSDVVARPTIKDKAHAGKPVVFAMSLTTKSSPACDFTVTPDTLVVKITSGSDRIWSTQDCHAAIARQSVVLRKDTPVDVDVTWSGQRSDSDCSRSTTWAQPGYYHAMAAAFGAEPVDEQFELLKPTRPTVTAKPTPDAKASAKPATKSSSKPSARTSAKPHARASSKPSKKPAH